MWAGSLLRLGQHLFTKRGYLTAKLSSRGSALREIEPNNRNALFYRRHSPLYDPTGNGNSGGRTKPFPCSVFPPATCTLSLPEHLTGFKELNSVGACLTPHKYQGLSSIFSGNWQIATHGHSLQFTLHSRLCVQTKPWDIIFCNKRHWSLHTQDWREKDKTHVAKKAKKGCFDALAFFLPKSNFPP